MYEGFFMEYKKTYFRILNFKQQSDYNLNVNFDVSKNWKHSEATVAVVYGPDKKDFKKRIEFTSALNHILNWKQKKFNLDANTKFIFPYLVCFLKRDLFFVLKYIFIPCYRMMMLISFLIGCELPNERKTRTDP